MQNVAGIRSVFGSSAAAMGLFVLLWGSAAIVTRLALNHATPSAVLLVRYGLALVALLVWAMLSRQRRWPMAGTARRVLVAGLFMVALYSVAYFQAMAQGITPGLLATVLGVQPIATLLLTERQFGRQRLGGLLIALCGLVLVVWQSLAATGWGGWGLAWAFAALVFVTSGTLLQKRVAQAPLGVLPLQYAATLVVCALFAVQQPVQADWAAWGFWWPTLWLGLVVSGVAQLLLYRLMQRGNLVNVTSLFYVVPVVTAVLDWLWLGNALGWRAAAGMVCILCGVALVLRRS